MMLDKAPISIHINDAYLRYLDSEQAIFKNLNIEIKAGVWTCILGRSGCGKSSILRYLANLLDGKVQWQGNIVTDPHCDSHHQIAYMAQQDLLMPWLSVIDNVLLSTKFAKTDKNQKKQQYKRAQDLLQKVGLSDKADCLAQQLSGGMRQRVALARTLMQEKPIVLMDEPFSALDAVTRYRLQSMAYELLQHKTVVLITHDPQEAIRLASQLYIMQGKPAYAELLPIPATQPPRNFDATSAQLQQQIMNCLEQDYE